MLGVLSSILWTFIATTTDWLFSLFPFLNNYRIVHRLHRHSESGCYRRIASEPPLPQVCKESPILSLPDELLGMMLSYSCDPRSNFTRQLELSAVCRRFRHVALYTPELWTSVHVRQSRKWWALQIERSRRMGLHICFSMHMDKRIAVSSASSISAMWCANKPTRGGECACLQFLAFFAPYKDRWESFSFQIHHVSEPARMRIESLLGLASLHRLRLLEFIPQDVAHGFEGPVQTHFCDDWDAPNLKSIVCTDEVNQSNTLFALQGQNVKTLSVRASHPLSQPNDFRDVLQVASITMLMVEFLLLTFNGRPMYQNDPRVIPEPDPTTFQRLRVLSIHLHWRDIQQPFTAVLPQLHTPMLELLIVKFDLLFPVHEGGAHEDPFDAFGRWVEMLLVRSHYLKDIVVVIKRGQALSSDSAVLVRKRMQARIERAVHAHHEHQLDFHRYSSWKVQQKQEGLVRRSWIASKLRESELDVPVGVEELDRMKGFQLYPGRVTVPDFYFLLQP